MTILQVNPANLRSGAGSIDAEKATVAGLAVPDATAAMAGLTGFATAGVLAAAHDAVVSALKVAGGRFELMAALLRQTADTFEIADLVTPGLVKPPWMSQHVGEGLTAMGEMNLSRH
ncbi:hypothetical protein C0J29_32375 (plasmid) [Mycobacterium paragordonae]|nr:hypothetical protein [Mycobacterium paragordonae]AYE99660.1 hypothetical protein C0J29_32375 [Mycobacterium paragordonae]